MVFGQTSIGGSKMLFECKTLELGWKDNQTDISCAPEGIYDLEFEYSDKFRRKLWELKGVPNRSEIKIHIGNSFDQIRGCILLGDMHKNVRGDDSLDVRNSRITVERFHRVMEPDTVSTIKIIGQGDSLENHLIT